MRENGTPRLWSVRDVDHGTVPASDLPLLTEIVRWSREFLVPGHPELGRTGPVCPYTKPSQQRNLFYLTVLRGVRGIAEIGARVQELRRHYEELAGTLAENERQLLTFLLLLPEFDPEDATPLDDLQRQAKPDFVASGLMIGQFHPTCEAPGLWNPDFRPLRAPVPLLAIRRMLAADLPFLLDSDGSLDAYLARFAPAIPARARAQLAGRLVGAG
ncbi:DUF6875 domain-containing protein [Gandjariella thermophila]|uniref:DUF6875 domain-containing protein n=1 Tax=Gandjariella thermophila TaxID=1931992 RepID=A0A4D4J754_9PSEU|nr:hypothetical protein [Gandjariella thermophila]GDY30518.1 hypothetical protein GTS_21510 [Gandjariella thermophila]